MDPLEFEATFTRVWCAATDGPEMVYRPLKPKELVVLTVKGEMLEVQTPSGNVLLAGGEVTDGSGADLGMCTGYGCRTFALSPMGASGHFQEFWHLHYYPPVGWQIWREGPGCEYRKRGTARRV